MRTFTLHQVHDNAWAAIADRDGVAVGNAGFTIHDGEVLVFDTTVSTVAGHELRAAAERYGTIAHVVYSHWHGDHVYGANAMPGSAQVIATEGTKQLMETRGVERLQQLKANPPAEGTFARLNDELPRLQLVYPDETFVAERSFAGAQAITYGGGHTLSDAFLWLAHEHVLFAADLVVYQTHPWVGDGDVEAWTGILERIAALGAETIVPGHGPVCGPEAIDFMLAYLHALRRANAGDPVPRDYESLGHAEMWTRNLDAVQRSSSRVSS